MVSNTKSAREARTRGRKSKKLTDTRFLFRIESLEPRQLLATLTVTSLADHTVTGTNSAPGTLRQAVFDANQLPGPDEIRFSAGLRGEIALTAGQLTIAGPTSIVGPGATALTVNAGGNSRVFFIGDGAPDLIDVVMSGLTITGGNEVFGAGILNRERLTIRNSTISGNVATHGGGIKNAEGDLSVFTSTIEGNTAEYGAGLYSDTDSFGRVTTIVNSTISGNTATAAGGGAFNKDGLLVIQNSTVTENQAPSDTGGGMASLGTTDVGTEVLSTIISGNVGNDVQFVNGTFNSFISAGFNLIGVGNARRSAFVFNDQTNITDPGLGPLASNGGSTQTHAVLPASLAVDQGYVLQDLLFDQRGAPFHRVVSSGPDVGAFEFGNSVAINGDFNDDGIYDCGDIDALVAEIAASTNLESFDLTGDGLVNLGDRDAWLAEAGGVNLASGNPYELGDANLDGLVDVADLNVWNSNKFTPQAAWCRADFNADGGVDVSDYAIWNSFKFTSADGGLRPTTGPAGQERLVDSTPDAAPQRVREVPHGEHPQDSLQSSGAPFLRSPRAFFRTARAIRGPAVREPADHGWEAAAEADDTR